MERFAIGVSASAIAQIVRAARHAFPAEACGGLFGQSTTVPSPAGPQIVEARPTPNRAGTLPGERYFIPPADVLGLERAAAKEQMELLGFFHSHPGSTATPSERDRAAAFPGYLYAILPLERGRTGPMRIYLTSDIETPFIEQKWIRVPRNGVTFASVSEPCAAGVD